MLSKSVMWRGTAFRDWRHPKSRNGIAGSEAEGLYGLLRGALITFPHVLCSTPSKKCHQAPITTVYKPPPQELREVKPKPSAPAAKGDVMAQEAPSLAISQALEVAIPTHMTPLDLNVGASRVYKCQVEGVQWETIDLPGCHMHSCVLGPFGVRLACPSCTQTQMPLGITKRKVMPNSSCIGLYIYQLASFKLILSSFCLKSILWLLLSPVEVPGTNNFLPTLASVYVYKKRNRKVASYFW